MADRCLSWRPGGSSLRFLLSLKSACVRGRVIGVGTAAEVCVDGGRQVVRVCGQSPLGV
ncbi:hypothetical protein [Streptomyces sp. NBC_01530]|uniref:hypothetical protein n=1 Tax=Streptomyces sp. NBC_01530 TaxID=2903895 RepID=UPI00386E4792